jgi:hypothetical protein
MVVDANGQRPVCLELLEQCFVDNRSPRLRPHLIELHAEAPGPDTTAETVVLNEQNGCAVASAPTAAPKPAGPPPTTRTSVWARRGLSAAACNSIESLAHATETPAADIPAATLVCLRKVLLATSSRVMAISFHEIDTSDVTVL